MFGGTKLPSKLQRAVSNLSTTVQVLLSEIVLAVEGHDDYNQRTEAGKIDYAHKNKRATQKRELELERYLEVAKLTTEDAAIGLAAIAGRSTAEIADFFEIEQLYAMRRLCAIRKKAEAFAPRRRRIRQMVQLCFAFFDGRIDQRESDVVEEFVQAQRRS